uniref:Uncharacterized protein n=1 Tax=Pseudomonas phage RVTF4 TaxID=3236931 RepID=A0AB39CCV5_9VIRU
MYSQEIMKAIGEVPVETNAVLAFNRIGGAFFFSVANVKIEDLSGEEHLVYVEANFNATTQEVIGNYPDHQIVNKSDLPEKIYESELDKQMAQKITKVYPLAEQVNILGRAIQVLAKEHNIVLEELEEMLDYIQLARETNREQKVSYAADPGYQYISNDELERKNEELYAGGLHEVLGPREITGGRVFH